MVAYPSVQGKVGVQFPLSTASFSLHRIKASSPGFQPGNDGALPSGGAKFKRKYMCEQCKSASIVYAKRFCSRSCYDKYRYLHQRRVPRVCPTCGKTVYGNKDHKLKEGLCVLCTRRKIVSKLHGTGSSNSNWRGGSEGWRTGRFGLDKNGLSWKTQSRLARERDKHRCSTPGCSETFKRAVDVHHIVPYRVSFSHALENLKCYCQRCHRKEDAKCTRLYVGIKPIFKQSTRTSKKPKCILCGKVYKLNSNNVCTHCLKRSRAIEALRLRKSGMLLDQIAGILGVTHQCVSLDLISLGARSVNRSTTDLQSVSEDATSSASTI